MTDNEFLLFDRIQKIQAVIRKYGEENFYISFSGGKDSTVLSALVDMAVPDNRIPRVYANTGIEYNLVRDFVFELAKKEERYKIIKPTVPIKIMLEQEGYPFKSKEHAAKVATYQRGHTMGKWIVEYLKNDGSRFRCPDVLRYQFTPDFELKISDKCCLRLKEDPLRRWAKENNKPYVMLGIMPAEGGRRTSAKCLVFRKNSLYHFSPLVPVSKEWEDWLIRTQDIKICDIYKPPYNFERTGCKGCPFVPNLQEELDVLADYFPAERKQCEIIWEPVYKEYRRLGYRLNKEQPQITMEDVMFRRTQLMENYNGQ